MFIKDMNPRLYEMGKIKIGRKSEKVRTSKKTGKEWRPPEKKNHIFLTTLEKDKNDNFIVDEEMTKLVTIASNKEGATCIGPCMFLFDDLESNLLTAYCKRGKSNVFCRGDGRTASRFNKVTEKYEPIKCNRETCPHALDKTCKPTCILSVVFPDAPRAGGVYRFRSSGWNSTQKLQSGLAYFINWAGGKLAGIPFNMRINKGEALVKGKTIIFYYLSIEYGNSLRNLVEAPDRLLTPKQLPAPGAGEVQEALMLEATDEDLEEFDPEVNIDEESGVVTNREGTIIDRVDTEDEEEDDDFHGPFTNTNDEDEEEIQEDEGAAHERETEIEENEEEENPDPEDDTDHEDEIPEPEKKELKREKPETKTENMDSEIRQDVLDVVRDRYKKYRELYNELPENKKPKERIDLTKEEIDEMSDSELFRIGIKLKNENDWMKIDLKKIKKSKKKSGSRGKSIFEGDQK